MSKGATPKRAMFEVLPTEKDEVKAGPGKILLPDQDVVVPGQPQGDPTAMEYGRGSQIRLSSNNKLLYWRASEGHPEICVELLVGCLIQTVDAMKKHSGNNGMAMGTKKAQKLIENLEIVLGRKKLKPEEPEGEEKT